MTPAAFLRRLRGLARQRGVALVVAEGANHSKIIFGDRRTVLPRHTTDLKAGTLVAICKQLGLIRADLEE